MGAKVFVPCTDEEIEALGRRGTPLVPYHPDRPCWHADQRSGPRGRSGRTFTHQRRADRKVQPPNHRE